MTADTLSCTLCDTRLPRQVALIVEQITFCAPDCRCDPGKLAKGIRQVMQLEEPQDTETELMELESNAEAFERGFESAFRMSCDEFVAAVRHLVEHHP